MATKVFPMTAAGAIATFAAGETMNVSAVCRRYGISRQAFYERVKRVRVEGLDGFAQRSRRPHRIPQTVAPAVEDAVVEWRKRLADEGHDHGAATIQFELGRDGRFRGKARLSVPSQATIYRILKRRGFVNEQPAKRPKRSWRRFEAPAPNEMWQIDAMTWLIVAGIVSVFNIVDDHSRVACRSRAVSNATSEEAWTTFCQAGARWGLPARVLSDNGLAFSGKLRGFEVFFEARLRDAGINPTTGHAYHPQTTGKVERFQQTLKRWLARQDARRGLCGDLAELQARLDEFCAYYNEQRPHQGIGRVTPLERWQASPRSTPADQPLDHPPPRTEPVTLTANQQGNVHVGSSLSIGLGIEWAGTTLQVITDRYSAAVFHNGQLVRYLQLDRTRYHQPTGRKRGGPRRARKMES